MLSNGYEIALTNGPLKKARYINPAIEKELAEFKEEIAEKQEASTINKTYVFPRPIMTSKHTLSLSPHITRQNDSLREETSFADYDTMGGHDAAAFNKEKKQINVSSEYQFEKIDTDDDQVEMGEAVPILANQNRKSKTNKTRLTASSYRSSSNDRNFNGGDTEQSRLHTVTNDYVAGVTKRSSLNKPSQTGKNSGKKTRETKKTISVSSDSLSKYNESLEVVTPQGVSLASNP